MILGVIRYREFRPPPALESFVSAIWLLEHSAGDGALQRVVPDGHSELIVNWGPAFEFFKNGNWNRQPRIFLAGQLDGPLLLRPVGAGKTMGIRFHPQGAAAIFPQPMHELSGRFTAIDELSPGLARDLTNTLDAADPVEAAGAALLGAEGRRGHRDLAVAETVRRIALSKGSLDLGALAREIGVSVRQLERRFQSVVGLPPKVLCRIQRFQNIFRVLQEESTNWVDAAAACGYYDQAHLIRDCRNFSGTTPAVLMSAETDFARYFYERR